MNYDWPGNIRELQNAIEHAFILCHGGLIQPQHLPSPLHEACIGTDGIPAGLTLAEVENRMIKEALARNNGRKLAAARELGIDKTTLWRKMKRIGSL